MNLQLIKESFFQWQPVNSKILQEYLNLQLEHDSQLVQAQIDILDETLNSQIHVKNPVHPQIVTNFCKKCVQILESFNLEEIHQDFYVNIIANDENSKKTDDFCKTYFDSEGRKLVSLIESREFVSQGTTGLLTWPAAKFLLDFLLKNEDFQGKSALELGCGTGFLGISLLVKTQIKRLVLTDHHGAVMANLAKNLELNQIHPERFQIMTLDWLEENHSSLLDLKHDLMIGSDIVFDSRIVEGLVHIFKISLDHGKVKKIIIANVMRNEETQKHFQQQLKKQGLSFKLDIHNELKEDILLYQINSSN